MADHRLAHRARPPRRPPAAAGRTPIGMRWWSVPNSCATRSEYSNSSPDSPPADVEPDAERLAGRSGPARRAARRRGRSRGRRRAARRPARRRPSAAARRRGSASSSASCQSRSVQPARSRVPLERRRPVDVLPARAVRLDHPHGRGRQLRDPGEDRARRGDDEWKLMYSGERVAVDARCRPPPPSSSACTVEAKRSTLGPLVEVERLDAEPVAGQHRAAARRAPASTIANMPEEVVDEALAPLRPGLLDHLGVGGGAERVPEAVAARRAARGGCRCSR